MKKFNISNSANAVNSFVRTLVVMALVAMMNVSMMCAQNIAIKAPAFAQPLVEQWIKAYNDTHTEGEAIALADKNTVADIQVTVSEQQAKQLGQSNIVFGRYAILPFAAAGSEAARTFGNKKLNKTRLAHIYFNLDDEDDEFGDYADSHKGMTIYSGNSQATVANSFAEYFGQQSTAFRGKRIQGDDRFVNLAVSRDAKGLALNAVSNLYDLKSRSLREGIQLLNLDVNRRVQTALNDNNLDELIDVLEENESDAIAIANIGLSYDASNAQTTEFVSWVLTEGIKYNHQYGLLNNKVSLQASK
ncbi:MAG: hypothetical protein J6X31_06050 [Bacteroidales bacterium]|nr:hypothetical protein [Bacteroidales bacterium]